MEETKAYLTEDEDENDGAEEIDAETEGGGFDAWDYMADVTTLYEDSAFKVFQANNPEACEELLRGMKESSDWYWARTAQEPKKVFFIDDKAWKKRRMCVIKGESGIMFQGNKRSESAATWLSNHGTDGLIQFFLDNKFQYITSFLRTKSANKCAMASGVYHYPDDKISSKAYDSIIKIEIRKGVKSIPQYAFSSMQRVKEVVVPDGVRKIGNSAFSEMYGLRRIALPDTLKEIGDYAFGSWSPIDGDEPRRLFIPKSVTSVGRGICMVSGRQEPPLSNVEILCEAESKPEGWNSEWDVACGRRWGWHAASASTPYRYHVTWGASRPAWAAAAQDVNEDFGGGDSSNLAAEREAPLNERDVPEAVAHAVIDAYFENHGGEYCGHITADDARRNCYRPWGRDVVKWWLSSRTDGTTMLMADTADGQTEGIIAIEDGELDEILSGMGMRRRLRALEEGGEEEAGFIVSDDPIDGMSCVRQDVDGPEDDPGARELIRRFGRKRYWYIALSDGGYDRMDGFDLGGEYAKLNNYEEALRLWSEYPLEDELGMHMTEFPDDYCELHVELRCITDAEFETEGNAYDDELARDGDFSWTESEPVADRCLIYDPAADE